MKKKLFIGGAALLFAAVTAFNMNMLKSDKAGDVSLEAITIMQQAEAESGFMTCVYASGQCRFPDGFSVPGIKHY